MSDDTTAAEGLEQAIKRGRERLDRAINIESRSAEVHVTDLEMLLEAASRRSPTPPGGKEDTQPVVCEHGVRKPWACDPCDVAAWQRKRARDWLATKNDEWVVSGPDEPKVYFKHLKMLLAAPSPGAVTRVTGERLCAAFAETFNGGGWADAPEWENFDDQGRERWRRAEEAFLSRLQSAREGDAEARALLHRLGYAWEDGEWQGVPRTVDRSAREGERKHD